MQKSNLTNTLYPLSDLINMFSHFLRVTVERHKRYQTSKGLIGVLFVCAAQFILFPAIPIRSRHSEMYPFHSCFHTFHTQMYNM